MKMLILFCLCLVCFYSSVNAQSYPIETSDRLLSKAYYRNQIKLKRYQVRSTISANKLAYEKYSKGQTCKAISMGVGFLGGFFVGRFLVSQANSNETNYVTAGVGASFILASVFINLQGEKLTSVAIDRYNTDLQKSAHRKRMQLDILMNGNGIGVSAKF